jgi:hypothetical protein
MILEAEALYEGSMSRTLSREFEAWLEVRMTSVFLLYLCPEKRRASLRVLS